MRSGPEVAAIEDRCLCVGRRHNDVGLPDGPVPVLRQLDISRDSPPQGLHVLDKSFRAQFRPADHPHLFDVPDVAHRLQARPRRIARAEDRHDAGIFPGQELGGQTGASPGPMVRQIRPFQQCPRLTGLPVHQEKRRHPGGEALFQVFRKAARELHPEPSRILQNGRHEKHVGLRPLCEQKRLDGHVDPVRGHKRERLPLDGDRLLPPQELFNLPAGEESNLAHCADIPIRLSPADSGHKPCRPPVQRKILINRSFQGAAAGSNSNGGSTQSRKRCCAGRLTLSLRVNPPPPGS